MKLFFVGSRFHENGTPLADGGALQSSMRDLAEQLAGNGHQLVVCSPFEDSVDLEVLAGAARTSGPRVEIHYPDTPDLRAKVDGVTEALGLPKLSAFRHPNLDPDGDRPGQYSWLFAQLAALNRSHVLIAAGGNPAGSSNLLLHVAEAQRKPILPLSHLGGSALDAYERLRYTLEGQLGDLARWPENPTPDRVCDVVRRLTVRKTDFVKRSGEPRLFLSYAKARPAEADLVESLIRRRGLQIFRDDQSFEAGKHLPTQIREQIHRSDIFIALWSSHYACSPWCHDELELALDRRENGLELWILDLDGTRMVPPRARELVYYPCHDRAKLIQHLNERLEPLR